MDHFVLCATSCAQIYRAEARPSTLFHSRHRSATKMFESATAMMRVGTASQTKQKLVGLHPLIAGISRFNF